MIDPSLILSYREAKYHVFNPALVLKIGELNPLLDKLLLEHGNENWAFITASNPFSNLLPEGVNGARFALLKEAVKSWLYFEGEGVGTDPFWKPEQSLLILGINENDAIEIGKSFEQNAIVAGRLYSPPKLIITQTEV
jgi:Protein of unknown function (DUF3293)